VPRGGAAALEEEMSEVVPTGARLGTLEVLCIGAPYETYEKMYRYKPEPPLANFPASGIINFLRAPERMVFRYESL
jgi:hypothetical protein